MFRAISGFLSNLLDGTVKEEGKIIKNEPDITEKESTNANLFSAHGAKFDTDELQKVLFGKVTKLYDDSGLVDEEVYFNFNKVIGGVKPTLNCEVRVEASRSSVRSGWRADKVEIINNDWDEFGDDGTEEILIGEITDINEKYFMISQDTYCPMASLAFGYTPCRGDWVRAEIIRDRGLVTDVKVVIPLREKSLTGTVTSVGCGHGYINTDIFFTFGSCRQNYAARKGHTVRVTAIESNQGNCKWRALKVEPRIPRKDANNPNMVRMGTTPESKFTKMLLENKADVAITDEINFSDLIFGQIQESFLLVRNDGVNSVVLKSIDGLLEDSIFKIDFSGQKTSENVSTYHSGRQEFDVMISPKKSAEFKVTVNSRMLGEFTQLVVFNFGNFQIGRFFKANVRDEQQNLLDARTPYHYHKRSVVSDNDKLQGWVVPGERRMFKQKTINISTKLGKYEVPRTLKRCILNKMDLCCLVPSLAEPLIVRNYKERFSALLHAEEVQMEMEMREFDLQQVSLKPAGKLLSLAVPGLAEGRPSLLIGDRVILSVSGGSNNSPRYEGFIHEVLGTEVLLKFHEDFHVTYDMDSYDVMFFFNRTPLRRCHKAVETAKFLADQVLFPNEVLIKLPQELVKNDKGLFNSKLNERQRAAVSRILIGQCRPMPYVLFGPPGTGKTVTLVEAILQIFHRIRCSRILACAPSNSAADLIAERLHHSGAVSEGDMVRLNAFQRQQNLPEDIENYSTNIDKLDVAAHYRIVICTCTTSGQLQTLGLAPGHFTHVIIDEAGQATEPESLVPISFLTGTEGQIILGGDPYQLGAVLRSPISQTYGLSISLLERLMTRIPYQRDESKFSNHGSYDPLLVTKLINNYRSHEALLELPSRLFYHSEMVTCAEDSVKNSLCCWDTLPNKNGFPILFHGIKGEDLREGNSPSWFNAVEAVQVIRYVQELRKFKKHPVQLSDIGIITPYRKQVEKIRLLLDRLGMSEIKVGSVEEFQGQERLVIIISTVRSCETLIAFDYTHNIGFLSNPKRFNVAITRAQALMIVIGNPHVLVKDSNWRALLQYCLENKSYLGCDLPFLNEHIENDDCFESCEETRRNDGQVDGDCEIHEHDEFIRSRNINIQQKDTVEGILGNHIERDMDPLKIHHAPGNGRLTDDTAGDCTSGKNGIDCKTCSNIGGILVEKVGVNGIPMDTLEIDRVEKSKGDASCNSMNELVVERPRSGSAVDSEGILIDKLGICDEEISKRDNAGHCCVNRYSEPKTLESNSIFRSEMLWSGHATKSSEFSSAIRNDKVARGINCSDSETSSRSVVECQDNESSDEDIEEIVYKGEME